MTHARFQPSRLALFVALLSLLGALPLALSVSVLFPILLLPFVGAWWVLRASVVADPAGLSVCNGLGVAHYAWTQVDGFDIGRLGDVRLAVADGRRPLLSAVGRRDLRALLQVADAAGRTVTPD